MICNENVSTQSQIIMLVPGTEFSFCSASLGVSYKLNDCLMKKQNVDKYINTMLTCISLKNT